MSISPKSFLFLALLLDWNSGVSAAQISCADDQLETCVEQLQPFLDAGVDILKDANDTFVGQVCGAYEIKRSCLSVFMYYCPTFKKQLQNKVQQFDYACSATDRSANWPFMPTISPTGSDRVDEELAAKEKANMFDSAIKASVAAAVTILLILVCVLADCVSKWRIQQRIKKAASAASGEQPLLKNTEVEETADTLSTEQEKKKEQQ